MKSADSALRYSALSRMLVLASEQPRLAALSLRMALTLEGGQLYSGSAREIMRRRFGVSIGAYSYGPCFTPGQFHPCTVVGRYVSIGPGVRVFPETHPTDTLSTHPLFYNGAMAFVENGAVPIGHIAIEHDAWVGANVVVTARCQRIGVGAVIGAGTILTRNVPDFAVIAGVPGEVVRFRFSEAVRAQILESKWWELSPAQLAPFLPELSRPVSFDSCSSRHLSENIRNVRRNAHKR